MNWHTIPALIRKDLTLIFRNKFYTMITIVGLLAYIGVYFAMPSQVDEIIEVGIFAPSGSAEIIAQLENDGLTFQLHDSEESLKQAVLDDQIVTGIALPPNLQQDILAGEKPTVDIYLPSDIDQDTQEAMQVVVETIFLTLSGQELNIDANEVILGPDLSGQAIPPRDRILPLFAVVVLMFETLGLSSLLAEEIQAGAIRALLVSPMGSRELFIAKGLLSVAFVLPQSSLLMIAVGAMFTAPLLILTILFLGALLVTGVGFLLGTVGKDMLSVMAWGVLAMILLLIPSFGVLFPGTMTAWAKLIPSYFLVDAIHQVVNFDASWSQITTNLVLLLAWDLALLFGGAAILKRKFT